MARWGNLAYPLCGSFDCWSIKSMASIGREGCRHFLQSAINVPDHARLVGGSGRGAHALPECLRLLTAVIAQSKPRDTPVSKYANALAPDTLSSPGRPTRLPRPLADAAASPLPTGAILRGDFPAGVAPIPCRRAS